MKIIYKAGDRARYGYILNQSQCDRINRKASRINALADNQNRVPDKLIREHSSLIEEICTGDRNEKIIQSKELQWTKSWSAEYKGYNIEIIEYTVKGELLFRGIIQKKETGSKGLSFPWNIVSNDTDNFFDVEKLCKKVIENA